MIPIEQLRYVRLGTGNLPATIDFAQRILGLELAEQADGHASFRSDFRDYSLVFSDEPNRSQTVGLEVRNLEALQQAEGVLARNGYAVTRGDAEGAAWRKVKAFLAFTDETGVVIELVIRPLDSGWRYFPCRDAGITGIEAVALRSSDIAKSEALWTKVLSGTISDWVGDAAYIRFDRAHHRVALHPSSANGILAVEFAVESVDQLMQNSYFLQDQQIRIVHGPGRRPTSRQIFLSFAGPDGMLFSYVAEGDTIEDGPRRPRQFPRRAQSFCMWGSRSEVPEFETDDDVNAGRGRR